MNCRTCDREAPNDLVAATWSNRNGLCRFCDRERRHRETLTRRGRWMRRMNLRRERRHGAY